jgi:methyl-accepting chemotaxis protein
LEILAGETMFKNWKIGWKIGGGYALLILIGMLLGAWGYHILGQIQTPSRNMAMEYVPEVSVSHELERNNFQAMYNIRGYAYARREDWLAEGRTFLERVGENIRDARRIAGQYEDLTTLGATIDEAGGKWAAYEKLLGQTVAATEAILEAEDRLDASAAVFIETAETLLEGFFESAAGDIRGMVDVEGLIERINTIQLLHELIVASDEIRIANFKAQARRSPEGMREAFTGFQKIESYMSLLEPAILQGADEMDAMRAAAVQYRAAMEALLENWIALESLNEERETTGGAVLGAAQEISRKGMDRMIAVADEVQKEVKEAILALIVGLVAAAVAGALMAFFVTRGITGPIRNMGAAITRFGSGDLSAQVEVPGGDEVGRMADDLNAAMVNLRQIMRELADNANGLSSSSEELSSISTQMAASAEEMNVQAEGVASASGKVNASVETVASAAEQASTSVTNVSAMTEEMSTTFDNVARASQKTTAGVDRIAASSGEISNQVNTVASSSEEMTASLNEVAKNTANASRISRGARERTEEINSRMRALAAASKQIGKVVGVIKDIADQTNMLALNATIEAAGAGDAGKGFAVVAGEVKELARQSAEATDEIAGQIEDIQSTTEAAVGAIEEINTVINEIAGINEMIAASVEEQTATAGEISKSVASTAGTVREMAEDAGQSAALVRDIANSTDEAARAAREIARNMEEQLSAVQEVARAADGASQGVRDISRNIEDIGKASRQTAVGAAQTQESSKELARMAATLNEIIKQFRIG